MGKSLNEWVTPVLSLFFSYYPGEAYSSVSALVVHYYFVSRSLILALSSRIGRRGNTDTAYAALPGAGAEGRAVG